MSDQEHRFREIIERFTKLLSKEPDFDSYKLVNDAPNYFICSVNSTRTNSERLLDAEEAIYQASIDRIREAHQKGIDELLKKADEFIKICSTGGKDV